MKARGRGVAAVNYPTGMNLGGDPSQALVHATTTGNFVVTLSSVDVGQGLKTVMRQICAETIGVRLVSNSSASSSSDSRVPGAYSSRQMRSRSVR
jgi:CO/xanthine dehydrogenase Mo-binding subunit